MVCPLCAHPQARPSWFGSTFYRGQELPYVECLECGSLFCDPMPDEQMLAQMYGPEYQAIFQKDDDIGDGREVRGIFRWLDRLGGGTFIDYGCGTGELLTRLAGLNWRRVGVEFDPEVAARVERVIGVPVTSDPAFLFEGGAFPADVLHLGDVIEHLTDLDRQLPEILRLVKPGGVLLAQGPLEANPNLFMFALRLRRQGRRKRTEGAPYHVLFATARGQRALFRRFGLEELEFSVSEIPWPAPYRLSRSVVKSPRALAFFLLRRISQAVTRLRPGRWGNRYFYAGRLPAG